MQRGSDEHEMVVDHIEPEEEDYQPEQRDDAAPDEEVASQAVAPSRKAGEDKFEGMFKRCSPPFALNVAFNNGLRDHIDERFPTGFPTLARFFEASQTLETFTWGFEKYVEMYPEDGWSHWECESANSECQGLRNAVIRYYASRSSADGFEAMNDGLEEKAFRKLKKLQVDAKADLDAALKEQNAKQGEMASQKWAVSGERKAALESALRQARARVNLASKMHKSAAGAAAHFAAMRRQRKKGLEARSRLASGIVTYTMEQELWNGAPTESLPPALKRVLDGGKAPPAASPSLKRARSEPDGRLSPSLKKWHSVSA